MIEKALIIIIFMYSASFAMLGVQYVVGDVLDIEITNLNGVPIRSHLVSFVDIDTLNEQTAKIVAANYTTNSTFFSKIETFTTGAAYVAWELITILTGTYIFNFMYLMGVPLYFVAGFVFLYAILLARAIIGYVRGI